MRHEVEEKLPAVSGSSGHLVVERCKDDVEPDYPGRVFEDPELDYAAAMREFVSASAQVNQPEPQPAVETGPSLSHQAEIRQFHQAEDRLRQERREVRQRQAQEDAVWQTLSQQHQEDEADFRQKAKADRHQQRAVHQAKVELWKSQRDARRETLKKRQQEDADWRQQRQALLARMKTLPIVTAWIAILVIIDDGTRQCLGLPLFAAGSHVTAEMVVSALRILLPAELQFLISDRGVHFTAEVFHQLAKEMGFIHVVVARHRPESNGIAERFVRTLKEWLAFQSWENDQDLRVHLDRFRPEYNDRPHQGLGIPGLSPNEFANRIWLM